MLKPTLVFFGESLQHDTRIAAERLVEDEESDALLVLGSSLATFSAWRLVKRAKDLGKRIGMVNLGGVRGEEIAFWGEVGSEKRGKFELGDGSEAVRVHVGISEVMGSVVDVLEKEEKSNNNVRRRRRVQENPVEDAETTAAAAATVKQDSSGGRVEHHNVAY